MKTSAPPRPLQVGDTLSPFVVPTLAHGQLRLPTGGLVHLQFRRFAGCPICSLHLRSFATGISRLEAAGVLPVVFFHSSADELRPFHAGLPFAVVPDPEREWYERFGVERSLLGVLHPKAMWSGVVGLATAPSHPLRGGGGHDGLPSDFLLGPDGAILAIHRGHHADDQWSLGEVLDEATRHAPSAAGI